LKKDVPKKAASNVFSTSKQATKSVSAPVLKEATKPVIEAKVSVQKESSKRQDTAIVEKPIEKRKREDSPDTKRQKDALDGMFDEEEEEDLTAPMTTVRETVETKEILPVVLETRRVRKTRRIVSQVTTKQGKYLSKLRNY
jgi:hypothetical protein